MQVIDNMQTFSCKRLSWQLFNVDKKCGILQGEMKEMWFKVELKELARVFGIK